MPHLRKRYIESLVSKALNFSPIVGVFGHRQVGKTTLTEQFSEEYVTMDNRVQEEMAYKDPETFLKQHEKKLFVIDECQMVPPLFPALKEHVRLNKRPGQFLLTGSVRFSSRKLIRESLTGRMIAWELLPMDLSEANEAHLPDKIPQLLNAKSLDIPLKVPSYATDKNFNLALNHGGLPGIFAVRDAAIRAQRFETMINTILERDLKLIMETTLSYSTLYALLKNLSLVQGKPLSLVSVSRESRISVQTLKKLIAAFEAMYLIRLVPSEGTEKKPVLFFEDQGEATHLSKNRYDDFRQLERLIYSQLRVQVMYRPELGVEVFQFRNRAGACVPLCFRGEKSTLGIIPSLTELPENGALQTARSFLKIYKNSKVLFVHKGKTDVLVSPQIRSVGLAKLV